MDKLTIRNQGQEKNNQIFNLATEKGFNISNPEQKKGHFIDLIIRDKQKIIGWDLFVLDSLRSVWDIKTKVNLEDVENWIDEKINT